MTCLNKVLLLVSLLALLLVSGVHANKGLHAQQHFERHDDGSRPPVEFAAPIDAPPTLVKSQYNQFAAPPAHAESSNGHSKKHSGDKVSRKKLVHWMHKLGLHPNKHQVDSLYRWIDRKHRHKHHGEHHHMHHGEHHHKHHGEHHHKQHHDEKGGEGKDGPGREHGGKPAWVEVGKGGGKEGDGGGVVRGVGILPPGTPKLGKARGWGDESSLPPTTLKDSPAAAAVAPLPEPVNAVPARTISPHDQHPTDSASSSSSSIKPPLPAGGLLSSDQDRNSSRTPVTSLPSTAPSSSSSSLGSETSGSLNPSSTPPPPPTANNGGDPRLAPLATSSNSSGQTIAGVPIAKDDGDLKVPQPRPGNNTSKTGSTSGASSAASTVTKLEVGGWTANALVAAGTVVLILLFAV
ncbi:uncharacterized protein SPSC_05692 [Sporisorium scitamineum]|uniref:Uncharacterized protein n=1 Tax=Sporisorium scitamineum TaxID=49012 RepID=A0A0F7RXY9_9BASI|nr:uncharacterized protein SPSC_05692 [Sporisorium scitamineum]CDS01896.1 hypothetical protein [Sporisorium scitamineum]